MKLLRLLLIGGAILVGLLAIVVVLAFTPSVQTWAVRRVLSGQPDMKGAVAAVDIGLHQTRLTGLRIERPGMVLTVPSATVDFPLLAAAGKNVQVRHLVAKGWILDLTAPGAPAVRTAEIPAATRLATLGLAQVAAQAAPAAGFDGIFKQLILPVDLQLDSAELEGEIIFPSEPGGTPGRAQVTLKGGNLGAGKTAQFNLAASARLNGAKAPVNDLSATGVIEAKMDTPRSFVLFGARLDTSAKGPKFPNGARLKAELKAERAADGEAYAFGLRSLQDGGGKQLADAKVNFPYATRLLSGSWKIDAQDSDVAPFALGLPVPGFVATGEGQFESDRTFSQIHASGRFETTLEKLEVIRAPLAAMGRLRVAGDFDVVQHERALQIQKFSAQVDGARPVLALQALQGIELNPSTGELKVADPQRDLFRISLVGLPLAWVQAFVPQVSFAGDDAKGEFVARAHDGGVTLRSAAPLAINHLTVSQEGKLLAKDVDLSAMLSADYSPLGWQADVAELTLASGGVRFLTTSLKAGQQSGKEQPLKATGTYDANLPAALRQPALSAYGTLTGGRVSGDFTAVVTAAVKQIAAKIDLRDLRTPESTQSIPTATANVRADLGADGVIKVQLPLVVQSGERKSDLDATAEIRPSGARQLIDAQIVSNVLYVEDLQLLAAPLQAAQSTPPQPPSKPTAKPAPGKTTPTANESGAPEVKPFWSDFEGQLRLTLKKVIYSPDVQAADVAGAVKIGPSAITLDGVRMNMGTGSGARLNGGLKFEPKAKAPYVLDGDINVSNLNPGPILSLLNPQGKPTVEGQFDMVGKFSGEAARPDALGAQLKADVKLTSRGGKFNGFAAAAQALNLGKYEKGISTVASVLGIAASVVGTKTDAVAYAEQGRALANVVKRFIAIDFDQLNVELSHRPGEQTKISDFSLISPDLRLLGNGAIDNAPGQSLWNSPLRMDLKMAVRGDQAKDMQTLGLIKDSKDPLGYTQVEEKFTVDGTLSRMGFSAFFNLLTKRFGGQ